MSIIDRARLHNILTKSSRKIKSDKVRGTAPNSHIYKGVLWNQYSDPIEGENLMKFIHETKTKDNFNTDKISFKNDTKCIKYTPRRSNRTHTKHENFMHMIRWVTCIGNCLIL